MDRKTWEEIAKRVSGMDVKDTDAAFLLGLSANYDFQTMMGKNTPMPLEGKKTAC